MEKLFWNIQRVLRKKLLDDEKGVILPLFLVFLIVIMLLLVIITDIGMMIVVKHEMQGVADAGSIAGAQMATAVRGTDGSIIFAIDPVTGVEEAENMIKYNFDILKVNYDGIDNHSDVSIVEYNTYLLDSNQKIQVEIIYEKKTLLLHSIVKIFDPEKKYEKIRSRVWASAQPN